MNSTQEIYEKSLTEFDWTYNFSEDARVHRAMHPKLLHLYEMQAQLDPQGTLWLEHSKVHGAIGIPQPVVKNV